MCASLGREGTRMFVVGVGGTRVCVIGAGGNFCVCHWGGGTRVCVIGVGGLACVSLGRGELVLEEIVRNNCTIEPGEKIYLHTDKL